MSDNSDPRAKVLLREWLLSEMHGPVNTSVLELFGGLGNIYDACYTHVKKHMAFELRKVDRPTWLQGDNRTLLRTRAQGWDLYDLDAYASPWILANDICRMREDGTFAMAITCGIYRSLNTGGVNGFVRQRIGLNGLANETGLITRWYMDIVELLMLDWARWGVTVKQAKHIGSDATHRIHYFGVIVEKTIQTMAPMDKPGPISQVSHNPAPKGKVTIKGSNKAKVP